VRIEVVMFGYFPVEVRVGRLVVIYIHISIAPFPSRFFVDAFSLSFRRFEAPELYDFPASCVEEADTVLISLIKIPVFLSMVQKVALELLKVVYFVSC
jgi:hypothetical protein